MIFYKIDSPIWLSFFIVLLDIHDYVYNLKGNNKEIKIY